MSPKPGERLRIAYVTAGLPYGHSGEEFFLPEISSMIRMGHVLYLIPRNIKGPLSRSVPGTILAHSISCALMSPRVLLAFARMLLTRPGKVWSLVRSACIDTTLSNTLRNLLVLPKGVWLARMVTDLGIQLIYVQWGSTTATMGEVAHQLTGTPWCMTLHRGDIIQNNRLLGKIGTAAFARFISESGVRLLRQVTKQGGPLPDKILVMHLGVQIPGADTLRPPRTPSPFICLCPANLYPVKGHIYLLKALKILCERGIDIRLLLAGQGHLRPQLESWLRDNGEAARVTFLGHLTQGALFDLYRSGQVNAVVLPSIDCGGGVHEGIPVSLMEAMAHALPVVSTLTGGIAELVVAGTGLLVPEKDPGALAAAIESLAADPAFAAATGAKGRERVLSAFNIEEIALSLRRLAENQIASAALLPQSTSTAKP